MHEAGLPLVAGIGAPLEDRFVFETYAILQELTSSVRRSVSTDP